MMASVLSGVGREKRSPWRSDVVCEDTSLDKTDVERCHGYDVYAESVSVSLVESCVFDWYWQLMEQCSDGLVYKPVSLELPCSLSASREGM